MCVLDDVYLLCGPARVEPLYKVLEETMLRIAGIRLHQGKTSVGNSAVVVPDNIAEVGQEAWQPDGITVLGTPIGSAQYINCIENGREDREGKKECCGRQSPKYLTSNARGKSSCRAQTHARITQCAHCRPLCPRSIDKHTMKASGALPKRCWGGSLMTRRRRRTGLRRCPCDWAVWAFVQQHVVRPATNPSRGHCSGAHFGQ